MTTPSFPVAPSVRDGIDTGPLSWVQGEIREALNRSKMAIRDAVSQDADAQSTSLRHARSYLHQAHGALQIVDIDGVALITETVEDLIDRIDARQIQLTAELSQAVENGYQALVEYLDELLSGMPHQPVRLFPYYRALLEARGAERIHPADLFFPNLGCRPKLPAAVFAGNAKPATYVALRQRFEKALLPFLKSMERSVEISNASIMCNIVGEIEQFQDNPQARAFWWVMHGLAEAVAAGQIDNEIYVKQLFARINLQIRRLSQGSFSITERLLRDALFFIAGIKKPSAHAQQIRIAYRLDGLVPEDYDKKQYGQIDVDALAAAKDRLQQVKNTWNRIAAGDAGISDSLENELRALADAGARLQSAPLSKLLLELKGIARHAIGAKPSDALGLEMATSLLFVENTLSHIGRLPENYAERADAMTARLLAVVAGQKPAQSAQWLDDISRQAQQQQTMATIASEMQSSLRQVEKILDEYFRDPSQRHALDQLDTVLHQVEGALAVLDQEDAMRTVRHTRLAVQRFFTAAPNDLPDQNEFQRVAQNVGALSFFIETLQHESDNAKKRFSFDETQGLFHANLLEQNSDQEIFSADIELPGDDREFIDNKSSISSLPTVEEELVRQQQQSIALAISLTEDPDNQALQDQLKESLQQIRLDAALVDNKDAVDRAQLGIQMLENEKFSEKAPALTEIVAPIVPAIPADDVLPTAIAPTTDEAIDAELLEIFLLEAEEVLGTVRRTLPESRNQPHNQEHLTTLRRSFHTLKGSGRMVGLLGLGEAAWSIEQVLNLRLSESRAGDAELFALLDKAAELIEAWVQDLKLQGRSDCAPHALIDAAERVKAGGQFIFEDRVDSGSFGSALPAVGNENNAWAADDAADTADAIDGAIEVPLPLESVLLTSSEQQEIGELPIESNDLTDFDASDDALVSSVTEAPSFDAAIAVPESDMDNALGVDPAPIAEIADDAITVLETTPVAEVIAFPNVHAQETKHDDNIKHIGDLEISVPLHNIYLAETDELVRVLAKDMAEWRHEPDRPVDIQSVHSAHSLAGSSATIGFMALQEVAHALEMVLQMLVRKPVRLTVHEFDTLEQSVERLRLMLQKFALGELPVRQPEYVRLLISIHEDIEGRLAGNADSWLHEPGLNAPMLLATDNEAVSEKSAEVSQPLTTTETVIAASFVEPVLAVGADTPADPAMVPKDELDADLLPVFFEEGRDLLPQLGSDLRGWQSQPNNTALPQSMLRLLHTLKGSARMAGAMALGQHLHDMETRVENILRLGAPTALAVDDLLIRYDQGLQMFEYLQNPQSVKQVSSDEPIAVGENHTSDGSSGLIKNRAMEPVVQTTLMPLQSGISGPSASPHSPVAHTISTAGAAPLVRVRADILDRLVNQAGEVSIARSKLETDVGTLKQSLSELTENVARLRSQLREIEMQAETQITSRMAQSGDREFDPLEFDRFTRLQELTRMMAESVSDVGSVHQNLSRTLDAAATDLTIQARLTRDLQQDLMRVRMVQFASISERLFRVTRQAAKEVDKRVNLDIRGSAVEIDRSVLEKMAGPFEHLLRNAIVHGIESREMRRAAGKSETGELLVEIRQEGNEVVIQFSDDGHGLDLERIRDKATRVGLLTDEKSLSDDEVADLIFHPGFSTAETITELAGRGIGMDVVRSEAAALGGRIATWSEPGKGTRFTIHLPLTLAVTQVVLLSTGGKTYAVPSVLVEQVQQLKTNALAAAYNDGAVTWQGQFVPMHYLATLLGDTTVSPVSQQYSPLVILRSGSDRVAVHVDEVIGNREVVVKNIGPQLARMTGIAGATVLGSGDIVLILNPVPLAQRLALDNLRAPRDITTKPQAAIGAVAEMIERQPLNLGAEPVQGLRTQSIVMVVDDSLTVRRVTQRLLSREGYQVVLAKDGVDALEHLQSITPDVMLVDIEMPRMDGFDLTRNVRGDERTRHIPIIMITSRTAAKHRNFAFELGVNEYLGKPYQEDQLLDLIAGFVGKKSSLR